MQRGSLTPLTALLSLTFALGTLALSQSAHAQVGGGGAGNSGSSTPPAASTPLKKNADRTDPVNFLLDRKKPLDINKQTEDSLKYYRGEMRHMQDVVFKDLDKAALKKENGQLPSGTVLMRLATDADTRIKDIQEAYRDRSRLLLNERQRQQVDSLEAIWKRSNDSVKPATLPVRRPPPRS